MKLLIVFIFTLFTNTYPYKCTYENSNNISNGFNLIRVERDSLDCRVFHICAFNRTFTFGCMQGFYFDATRNVCDHADKVECDLFSDIRIDVKNETDIDQISQLNFTTGSININENTTTIENGGGNSNDKSSDNSGNYYYSDIWFNVDEFYNVNNEQLDYNENGYLKVQTDSVVADIESITGDVIITTIESDEVNSNETNTVASSETQSQSFNSTRPWWLGPTECIIGFTHKIPHEDNCGKYYECQPNGEKIEYACIYPMQFDEYYYECRPYDTVDCGKRKEAKDLCDYKLSKASFHSIPCYMYPSCRNLSDGVYPDLMRDCRHYFQCKDERTLNTMYCPQNTTNGGLKFNYYTKRCEDPMRVSYTCGGFSIPIDLYTNKMICPLGSTLSFYSHPMKCNIYLSCLNDRILTMECPEGLHFSGKHQKCMDPKLAKCEQTYDPIVTDESTEQAKSTEKFNAFDMLFK